MRCDVQYYHAKLEIKIQLVYGETKKKIIFPTINFEGLSKESVESNMRPLFFFL